MDFGLVSRSPADISREALEVAGQVAGTVAYMAPEQGRGERVDARADLYSLGCILYHLITGRPPFLSRNPLEVLQQHFAAKPARPSNLVPGLARELDDLVLKLLEKEPRARFGYADDVSAALASLGIDAQPPPGAPPARPYLYRPGFAGRQDVIEQLRKHFPALHAGAGRMVLIGGESGVGKTRLLVELSRLASQEGLTVLTGECSAPSGEENAASGNTPLQVFRKLLQWVADRCRQHGDSETEQLLGRRGKVLEAYEPLLSGLPGLEKHAPPANLPHNDAVSRVHHCVAETLAACVRREGSLVLLLDDLQWADELSLGTLGALLRSKMLEKLPLLVVGVYRSEECGPELHKLTDAVHVDSLKLERLGGPAVTQVAADMLGLATPPQNFGRFLASQSEGIPFFVAEYLRAMVGQSLLQRDAAGRWQVDVPDDEESAEQGYASLPLPRSLLELISGRLSRLSPEAQEFVVALSVLGRESDAALIADVCGLRSSKVLKASLEAIVRQVVEPAEGERLRFVHDKLREVAYARLDAERRRELHYAAAAAMEEMQADGKHGLAGSLAHHWEQGGQPDRALPCYLAAAREAVARHGHAEAESHFRGYLRLVPAPSPESILARNELGEQVLAHSGRDKAALPEHEAALAEARSIRHRQLESDSLRLAGSALWRTRRMEESGHLSEMALAIAREIGDRNREGSVLGNLGRLHQAQGRMEPALQLYWQAIAIHRETGDRWNEGVLLGNLAAVYSDLGRLDEALPLYEQALELHREVGNRRSEGHVLANLALEHLDQGRTEEARRLNEQALSIAREVGARRNEGIVLFQFAILQSRLGCLDEALPLYERALELHREVGNRRFEGETLGNLSRWYQEKGRLDEAVPLCEQALAIHRRMGDRRKEGLTLLYLTGLHADRGYIDEAREACEQALAIHREIGDRLNEGSALISLASLHDRQGRLEEARRGYDQALGIAREVGNRREEGIVLHSLAHWHLLARGDLSTAAELGAHAEDLLTGVVDKLQLASLLCTLGHLQLAADRGGNALLARAMELASASASGPGSWLNGMIQQLQCAAAAFEASERHRLFRGYLIEELSEGHRRWLVENGHLERERAWQDEASA